MNQVVLAVVVGLVALTAGLAVGYLVRRQQANVQAKEFQSEIERVKATTESQTLESELKARNELMKKRDELEAEAARRRAEADKAEERAQRRREDMDRRLDKLERDQQNLNKRIAQVDKRSSDLDKREAMQVTELERIAALTRDEAKAQLLAAVEAGARNDMARTIRQIEDEAKSEGERRARELIAVAIQRVATDQVAELSVSVVPIASDEMKGRIIGRNGRNIRAFEMAAGVNVIVDDTPEAVTISSFDPVRREIARRSLAKLIGDGRIHPAYIEKLVDDARKEVETVIKEAGEQAAYEAGVPGLHPEVLRLVGRLKFRTSYGQNQRDHSIETSLLAGVLAAEMGADVATAKAAGLLHDLGKAIDHEVEGTHAAIGAEFAKRYGVHPKIVNAIAAHHHEVDQESVEAVIVEVADAISGSRPGARRESLELYVKRIRTLEDIASSYKGVEQAYALQAGREVRIIVEPDQIDDLAAIEMSKNIARKIEESMQYPGQIKVTVIREKRAVDYAK
ncbi:MAG: ribonuclease Y [Chloroflexi bacterium]|nr:ribonuclease Y [Chloroflexota bacterium]